MLQQNFVMFLMILLVIPLILTLVAMSGLWAINTLGFAVPYTFKTGLAVVVLALVFSGGGSGGKKK